MNLLNADTALESLPLSLRTYNCLKLAGLKTLGDVAAQRDGDLLRNPNFGRKSLNEILTFVRAMNEPSVISKDCLALIIVNSGQTYMGLEPLSSLVEHTQQKADLARYVAGKVLDYLAANLAPQTPAHPETPSDKDLRTDK